MLVPSNDMKRLWDRKAQLYHNQFQGSRGELYLLSRGITKEAANSFQIGFVENPEPDDQHLKGRISIPYITQSGVVGIKYRAIDDTEPKYLSSPGFYAKRFFNVGCLTSRNRKIYICEGETDAITVAQLGVPAVALPGAETWEPRMFRVLRNRFCVVLADGDDDGQGKRMADKILSNVDESIMIVMEGHDVNSFFNLCGEKNLLKKIGWNHE